MGKEKALLCLNSKCIISCVYAGAKTAWKKKITQNKYLKRVLIKKLVFIKFLWVLRALFNDNNLILQKVRRTIDRGRIFSKS